MKDRKAITTKQLKLRELNFVFDGATDLVSGFDELGIESVVDIGAGNYTFIFKDKFERACQLKGFGMMTADSDLVVQAVDVDRITVLTRTAGTAADTKFSLSVLGSDGRFNY